MSPINSANSKIHTVDGVVHFPNPDSNYMHAQSPSPTDDKVKNVCCGCFTFHCPSLIRNGEGIKNKRIEKLQELDRKKMEVGAKMNLPDAEISPPSSKRRKLSTEFQISPLKKFPSFQNRCSE